MKEDIELRMYGLVPYNLSPIQQGIQFGHAVVEYGQAVKNPITIPPMASNALEVYNDWANNWKTFIILNGGTTNTSQEKPGTLNTHLKTLQDLGVDLAAFYEPDLGDQLTAVVFIVDERVFNRKKYPDFRDWVMENYGDWLRNDSPNLLEKVKDSTSPRDRKIYQEWFQLMGGEKNILLREFLKDFRLA
jgi:hypothetical protein